MMPGRAPRRPPVGGWTFPGGPPGKVLRGPPIWLPDGENKPQVNL